MCCGRFTSGVPCAYIYIQVHIYRYVYTGTYIQVQIVRYNCAVADVSIDDMFVEDEAGDRNSGR